MTQWISKAPLNEASSITVNQEAPRTPIARLTIDIFTTSLGDSSVTIWTEKGAQFATAQGKIGPDRNNALLKLKATVTREIAAAIAKLQR